VLCNSEKLTVNRSERLKLRHTDRRFHVKNPDLREAHGSTQKSGFSCCVSWKQVRKEFRSGRPDAAMAGIRFRKWHRCQSCVLITEIDSNQEILILPERTRRGFSALSSSSLLSLRFFAIGLRHHTQSQTSLYVNRPQFGQL